MAIPHELPLLTTIAAGFCAAFVCGLVASKLRLSPIVGYLVAGILIGPFTPGFVANADIAEELSEIGILLLMFGVGLHFSVRDLLGVWRIALPGALVQIAVATLLGWMVCTMWGWHWKSGLMLGLALSVASTVVLLRALEEHDLLQTNSGNIAIGWLIVEDIVMVLALVLIPALPAGAELGREVLSELALALGKILFFAGFMLIAGRRLLPWLLQVVAALRSRELFTLAVFAVAMGVAFAASALFGVSLALGAFFAGMMIRESDLSQEAASRALPLQDAFAVLFFVSVGMLFDPATLVERPWQVLVVVAIILVGKSLAAALIVLLMRYPLKTALLVSAGLAQIGEFSFILANLGVSSGLLPSEGRDLILAGALISISLNPAFFHVGRWVRHWVARHPKMAQWFYESEDDFSTLPEEARQSLHGHIVLVGHGRVGKHISENLWSARLKMVVIDANRERIRGLRENGFHALAGDATHVEILRNACLENASAIIVAVPNPYEARRVVEAAKAIKPSLKVLVRAHNDEEMRYFSIEGVDLAVMGPREVGRRMVEFLNEQAPFSKGK